ARSASSPSSAFVGLDGGRAEITIFFIGTHTQRHCGGSVGRGIMRQWRVVPGFCITKFPRERGSEMQEAYPYCLGPDSEAEIEGSESEALVVRLVGEFDSCSERMFLS